MSSGTGQRRRRSRIVTPGLPGPSIHGAMPRRLVSTSGNSGIALECQQTGPQKSLPTHCTGKQYHYSPSVSYPPVSTTTAVGMEEPAGAEFPEGLSSTTCHDIHEIARHLVPVSLKHPNHGPRFQYDDDAAIPDRCNEKEAQPINVDRRHNRATQPLSGIIAVKHNQRCEAPPRSPSVSGAISTPSTSTPWPTCRPAAPTIAPSGRKPACSHPA